VEPDAHLSPAIPIDRPETYPDELEQVIVLQDGTDVRIRPIVPADIERIRHAFDVGDSESIRRRFLTGAPPSGESYLHHLVEVDYRWRLALIALDGEGNSIGIARYEGAENLSSAEIAIVVDPPWRQHGIGGELVEALEPPARRAGIKRFVAAYMPDNRAISDLLTDLGYGDRWVDDGLTWVAKSLV